MKTTLLSTFSCLALLGLASACSSTMDPLADSHVPGDELVDIPAPTPEENVLELERMLQGTLSDYERETVLDVLDANGVAEDVVTFRGRIVAIEGDGLLYADDLLAGALESSNSLDKGRVLTAAIQDPGLNGCTAQLPCPIAPTVYAKKNATGEANQFFRPFTQLTYYLVYPNNAPAFMTNLLNKVITRLYNAETDDCLHPDSPKSFKLQGISQSAYNLLTPAQKNSGYVISIVPTPTGLICPDGARGCALFPRFGTVTVDGQSVSRMRFGHVIGIATCHADVNNPTQCDPNIAATSSDGLVNEDGNEAVGVFLHELLHTMGFAHSEDSAATVVLGTQSATTATSFSIMRENGRTSTLRWSNWSSSVPADDRKMLRKLYGGSCNYQTNFRSIPAG